jgi:hypothetical protein
MLGGDLELEEVEEVEGTDSRSFTEEVARSGEMSVLAGTTWTFGVTLMDKLGAVVGETTTS